MAMAMAILVMRLPWPSLANYYGHLAIAVVRTVVLGVTAIAIALRLGVLDMSLLPKWPQLQL